MSTPESHVRIDAPAPSGERAAAAVALAHQLREELMHLPARGAPITRPPLYRLVHQVEARRRPGGKPLRMAAAPAQKAEAAPAEPPSKYVILGEKELKRLQQLAHLLATASGELNLWLAGIAHGGEEVER